MLKKHTMAVDTRENIDDLVRTLVKVMKRAGILIIPGGGYRGGLLRPGIDWSRCEFMTHLNQPAGCFRYDLKDGTYLALLDLELMPYDKYKVVMEVISIKFSRFLNPAETYDVAAKC